MSVTETNQTSVRTKRARTTKNDGRNALLDELAGAAVRNDCSLAAVALGTDDGRSEGALSVKLPLGEILRKPGESWAKPTAGVGE